MNKNIVVVTGGAGFVGSNLIQAILKYKQFRIISLDNYSSGSKRNHIISKRLKYINTNCLFCHFLIKLTSTPRFFREPLHIC